MTTEQIIEIYWPYIVVLALWTLVWKGIALWKSARLGHRNWFIALLVINSVGLLEIVYLLFFANRTTAPETPSEPM